MYREDQRARKHKINPSSKRKTMKKIILINFFLLLMMTAFVTIIHGQQRPSQRSYASVVSQVKQKQIAREKMLQQMKLTTPSNNASQNANIQFQPSNGSRTEAAPQQSQSIPKTNQQPVMNKPASKQQLRMKKE